MKKLLVCGLLATMSLGVMASPYDNPAAGDMLVDFGIGVGTVDYPSSKALFTQHLGVEFVVLPEVFSQDFTLAAGFYINNGFGAKLFNKGIPGFYDYKYPIHISSPTTGNTTNYGQRTGMGTANVNIYREDINFLPTVSLRYHAMPNLDAYMSFGIGLGVMNTVAGKKWNYEGFSRENSKTDVNGTVRSYVYNDLDHAVWPDLNKSEACFSVAWYIGARYAVTDTWGVNAQFGLIGANVKKSFYNSYNLFSVGATYSF